jgi:hypothetical protein
MRIRHLAAAVAAVLLALSGTPAVTAGAAGPEMPTTAGDSRLAPATSPAFLENGGRLPGAVAFTLDGADRTFFFGEDGVTIAVRDPARPDAGRWAMKLVFDGARAAPPVAVGERPGVTNLFVGPKETWRTGLRSFGSLVYRDAWPGVDLTWTTETGALKWRCDVRPGADPSRVGFAVRGAESVSLRDGALVASTPLGDFVDAAPVAWQTVGGRDAPVSAAFRLDAATNSVGVALGAYDASRALVIDPVTVVRAGFIGGVLNDVATSVVVDPNRNVYLAGITNSPETSFPTLFGPDQTYNGGTGDAFVVKIDNQFRAVWSGYLGGVFADGAAGVAVDQFGAVFVAGATFGSGFPVTGGPASTGPRGGLDLFVTKIAPSGQFLVWSAILGGTGEDRAFAVKTDNQGRVVVAGRTAGGMPWQGAYGGGVSDAFACQIRGDGTVIDWGTYLGGKSADWANGVALDASLNVYLCGNTSSSQSSFPVKLGPDMTFGGAQDAWVAKLDATTHTTLWAGYIGGLAGDSAAGIAVDSLGRAYVAGSTLSDEDTFPLVVGPHLVRRGKSEAFVARVAADGQALEYCGYIGGTGDETAFGIALDSSRRAYVVGSTGSTATAFAEQRSRFPVVDGPELRFGGGVKDGFLGVVAPDGEQMTSLGYVGGKGSVDDVTAVALHVNGDVVLVGDTTSSAATFPAGTGPPIASSGAREAFLAQLQYTAPSPLLLVPQLDSVAANGFAVDVAWIDNDPNDTGFEVERTSADGKTALLAVPAAGGATGPMTFSDTTASPGTRYAYRVRGVTATVQGEFSSHLLVKTTPSLNLTVQAGSLSGAGTDLAGVASLRMKYAVQQGSGLGVIDPVTDGITITIAGAGDDQVVTVPPGDANWGGAGAVKTWLAPEGGAGVTVNLAKRTLRVDASGLTFAPAQAQNTVRVEVVIGAARGVRTANWRGVGATKYAYP